MPKQPNPQVRTHDGRTVVNRDWMVERTGASKVTVALWYSKRDEQPAEARHPEKAVTTDRVDFYDQEQFETFYIALMERKKNKVLPTDPALYDGDPDDLISINLTAEWFHFAGAGVIRKYLKANPGYFPEPADTVEGPSGRPIPAFRRVDLQDFDRRRTGDGTGAAGRPTGPQVRPRRPQTEQRIATALTRLRKSGTYYRGMAAELAAEHGEPAWKWERAVKEARNQLTASAD